MMQCNDVTDKAFFSPTLFIDPARVEKKAVKPRNSWAQVMNDDFKYKMFWCMPERLAVNMPSAEKKMFHISFLFLLSSPSPNLFALRLF